MFHFQRNIDLYLLEFMSRPKKTCLAGVLIKLKDYD